MSELIKINKWWHGRKTLSAAWAQEEWNQLIQRDDIKQVLKKTFNTSPGFLTISNYVLPEKKSQNLKNISWYKTSLDETLSNLI